MDIFPRYFHTASLRTKKVVMLASLVLCIYAVSKMPIVLIIFAIFYALPVLWLVLSSLFFRDHTKFILAWDRFGSVYENYYWLFFNFYVISALFLASFFIELAMD